MNHCSFKWPHSSHICQSISLSFLYDTTTSATELCSKSEAEWQKPCDLDLLKTDPSSEGWSSSKWNRHPRTSELPSPWLLVHPYYLKTVASPSQDRNFLGTLTTLIILCPLCHLGHDTLDSWTSGHTHTHTRTHACTRVQAHGLFVLHGASSSQLHSDVHSLQNLSGKRSHMIQPQGMSFSVSRSPICRVNLRLDKAFHRTGSQVTGSRPIPGREYSYG